MECVKANPDGVDDEPMMDWTDVVITWSLDLPAAINNTIQCMIHKQRKAKERIFPEISRLLSFSEQNKICKTSKTQSSLTLPGTIIKGKFKQLGLVI